VKSLARMIIAVYKDAQEHFDATYTAHAATRAVAIVHFRIHFRAASVERRKISAVRRASPAPARARSGSPPKLPILADNALSEASTDHILLTHDVGCVPRVGFWEDGVSPAGLQ
jgi:hypothetical protein